MESYVPPHNRHYTATAYLLYKHKLIMILHKSLKKWLPPGGHIEWGEDPFQAVTREIREEVGIQDIDFYFPLPQFNAILNNEPRVHLIPSPVFILNEEIPNHGEHIDLIYFGKTRSPPSTPESHELFLVPQHALSSLNTFPNVKAMGDLAFRLLD